MPVSSASLLNASSAIDFGTGAHTTTGFTPTAGRRLVVVALVSESAGNTDPSGNLSIADSQSLTWTRIAVVGNAAFWSFGMATWISSAVPAGTSTTITLDCAARDAYAYLYSVLEVAGATGTATGAVADGGAPINGAYTVTLGATPTTGDLTIFARALDISSATTLTMGSGWTVLANVADSANQLALAAAVRTASTSNTASITDANTSATAAFKAIDLALILVAAGGAASQVARPSGVATARPGAQALSGTGSVLTGPSTSAGRGGTQFIAQTERPGPAGPVSGLGPSAVTSGSATVAATPANSGARGGSVALSGAGASAAIPGRGLAPAGSAAIAATSTIVVTASATRGGGPAPVASGTTGTTSVPQGALGSGPTASLAGAAVITAAPAGTHGSGPAIIFATATTLQPGTPGGAAASGRVSTASGTSAITTAPTGADALSGSTSLGGATSVTTTPRGSLGSGPASIAATATTLRAAMPAGARALGALASLSAAATLQALGDGAIGMGSMATTSGTASTTALPTRVHAAGVLTSAGPLVRALSGGVRGYGGALAIGEVVQLASRGAMTPTTRAVPAMTPTTRAVPAMTGFIDGK